MVWGIVVLNLVAGDTFRLGSGQVSFVTIGTLHHIFVAALEFKPGCCMVEI